MQGRSRGGVECRHVLSVLLGVLLIALAATSGALAAPAPRSGRPVFPSRAQVIGAERQARAHIRAVTTAVTPGARSLTITGSGFSPEAAVVVAQCSSQALPAALKAVSTALGYCDQSFVGVTSTGSDGSFRIKARALSEIQTASGPVNCRRQKCLLGAVNLDSLQGKPLQVALLTLGFSSPVNAPAAPSVRRIRLRSDYGGLASVTAAHPFSRRVPAYPAGSLGPGRVGRVVRLQRLALPSRPRTGEGLVALTMRAPDTSWSSPRDTSVTVQARVDRGPWQTMVLFAGSAPFTYEGFTGPLRTGAHRVQVRVRGDLSQIAAHAPAAVIDSVALRVVDPRSSAGIELAHAPVLYDRRVSATRDTPLITYADDVKVAGGARRLTYVVTWSHEDTGTGFVPWLEWGTWGRMTDIETAISFEVSRSGAISHSSYLTCVTCGRHFPENLNALDETEQPFRGMWFHRHPVLRVSTGNNDFSDQGTTKLRFQQALAAAPLPGETREGAMDRNPWTYDVMGQELVRNRADRSLDAASAAPGDPRQYLIVELDTAVRNATAVGVDLRLAGSKTVYSNDLGTTYPLYDGGSGRTVIKVPLGQVSQPISALDLRLAPGSGTPSIAIHRVKVLQYVGGRIRVRRIPRIAVVTEPVSPAATGSPQLSAN